MKRPPGARRYADAVGQIRRTVPRGPGSEPLRPLLRCGARLQPRRPVVNRRGAYDAAIARLEGYTPQPAGAVQSRRHHDAHDLVGRPGRHLVRFWKFHHDVRLAVLPGFGRRDGNGRRAFLHFRHAARPATVHPGDEQIDLARGEADVVGEASMAAHRLPRWHPALEDLLANRARPRPRFAVRRQRHREVLLRVALKALALQDLHDLALEHDVRRDRDVRGCRARAEEERRRGGRAGEREDERERSAGLVR